MQFKQTLVRLVLILLPFSAFSQTTYFPQGDKANILIERLEIKDERRRDIIDASGEGFAYYPKIETITPSIAVRKW